MKDVRTILQLSAEFLQKSQVVKPKRTAEELLAHFLQMKRIDLFMNYDRPLVESELEPFRAALKRRAKGEPVEYILQSCEFYKCQLKITPATLIPRPETEILLDQVCKWVGERKLTVLDLCTGSGCLAIGLKKSCPQAEVYAVDLSEEALEVAKENAKINAVEVHFLKGDLTQPVQDKKFDLVLCNPPYISAAEYAQLSREVKDFEPKMALVAGPTGYEFFERLAKELPPLLNPGAKIYFEMGYLQGATLLKLFSHAIWEKQVVEKDWAGHDRFFSAFFP